MHYDITVNEIIQHEFEIEADTREETKTKFIEKFDEITDFDGITIAWDFDNMEIVSNDALERNSEEV